HGYIEHDVSLSRQDAALGSNSAFDQGVFDGVMQGYSGAETTSWASASAVRFARVKASQAEHEAAGKAWTYGLKESILSYGESALYLNLLGKDGVAPVEWVRIFFGECPRAFPPHPPSPPLARGYGG
ncbi:hypothetical protein LTR53_018833, partial [Teratosphaeriaceae sp. CCFEE 6253]